MKLAEVRLSTRGFIQSMSEAQKVKLEGYIEIPVEDLELVIKELPIHTELTRKEEGCIVFEVTQDPNRNNRFNVYEVFDSQTSFSYHQERVKNSKWGEITKNAARHYKINQIGS